jgi:hypothetical protein
MFHLNDACVFASDGNLSHSRWLKKKKYKTDDNSDSTTIVKVVSNAAGKLVHKIPLGVIPPYNQLKYEQ